MCAAWSRQVKHSPYCALRSRSCCILWSRTLVSTHVQLVRIRMGWLLCSTDGGIVSHELGDCFLWEIRNKTETGGGNLVSYEL